jgi:hypothetical protein
MPRIEVEVDENSYGLLEAMALLRGLDIPDIISEWVSVGLEDARYAIGARR